MKKSISLHVNKSVAYSFGEKKSLDVQNENVKAQVIDGRTLVPARFLSENFGAIVTWDEVSQTVSVIYNNQVFYISIDKKEVVVAGKTIELEVPAMIIEGRTMLPLRAICENILSKKVFWDDRGLIVISDTELLSTGDKNIIDDLALMFEK